jgi:hypothetical protein
MEASPSRLIVSVVSPNTSREDKQLVWSGPGAERKDVFKRWLAVGILQE